MHKGGCRLWEATMDREIFAREISSKRKRLEDLAQQIWENPEEPFQETIAARLVAELLEQEGFQVERGAGRVPTALRAVWGHGSPVIGLLGEYDSLPQMGPGLAPRPGQQGIGFPVLWMQRNPVSL